MKGGDGSSTGMTKREFVKKTAYVVPAVLTLTAAPAFAGGGSNSKKPKSPKDAYYKDKKSPPKRKY